MLRTPFLSLAVRVMWVFGGRLSRRPRACQRRSREKEKHEMHHATTQNKKQQAALALAAVLSFIATPPA